jgi:hypothetical protein
MAHVPMKRLQFEGEGIERQDDGRLLDLEE